MDFIQLNLKDSSNIWCASYCYESKILYIWFKSGSEYQYSNIPYELVIGWENAPNVGKFFCKHIKPFPELYPYERMK